MTVLDGDITPQDISELVALSDHAAFSEPGLARLTGVKEMASALKQAQTLTNGHVYVTQGSAGCDWLENGGRQHQPAFKVDVVDTTGAGDVFHGALAVALATGGDLAESVRFASGVAALKCTRPGGRAGILTVIKPDLFVTFCIKCQGDGFSRNFHEPYRTNR